jgi:hypothetical protein
MMYKLTKCNLTKTRVSGRGVQFAQDQYFYVYMIKGAGTIIKLQLDAHLHQLGCGGT